MSDDLRRFRVDDELWEAFGQVVGNRSADLRRYMDWRVRNPDTPLPGEWRATRPKRR